MTTESTPMLTYWNGERTPARRVCLTVADPGTHPLAWYRKEGIVGTSREAVAVEYGGETFYLDDADGTGWAKVTEGHGGPRIGHRSVYPVAGSVIDR